MAMFSWLSDQERLRPDNLTVREQTRLENNPLDLRYPFLFPEVDSDSVVIAEVIPSEFRMVAGRREWNAQGREITAAPGRDREWEMIPINPTKHLDEYFMQRIRERGQRIQELIRKGIMRTVDEWATLLTNSVARQLEADAFETWLLNRITVRDTKSGAATQVAMGFSADRYVSEGVEWETASAFDRLLFHLAEAKRMFRGKEIGGVRMAERWIRRVVATAPNGPNGIRPTRANVEERLAEEGYEVKLIPDDRTFMDSVDGTAANQVEKYYVPRGIIAFQPKDGRIGQTHVAPVTRAEDFFPEGATDRVNLNDVVVMYGEQNNGKTLLLEAQKNALSLPEEDRLYVVRVSPND